MNTDFIKGIIPPIVTPIKDDESVDEAALRTHINFMVSGGISGILAFGSNSEFYMQEEDEMETTLKIIIDEVKGRVPVYMGVGAIRTSKCVRLAKLGIRLGAHAVSVLQPMYIKPDEDELYTHFKTIAESIGSAPMILYNNPGRAGYPMSQALVERLSCNLPNIIGMKDSSGDMTQTMEFIRRNKERNFKVLIGKDTLIVPGLAVGAAGAVCGTANFLPELVCSIYRYFTSGNTAAALDAQNKLNPIRLAMDNSTFPVASKDLTNLLGHFVGKPYLPTKPSPAPQMEVLKTELKKAGFL